jgi:hypothetical protein
LIGGEVRTPGGATIRTMIQLSFPGDPVPEYEKYVEWVVHDVSYRAVVDKHYVHFEFVHILNMSNFLPVGSVSYHQP